MALTKYANDLANQNYGDWQSKIGGLTQLGMARRKGMTGQQNQLANLDMGLGNSLPVFTRTWGPGREDGL